MGTQRQRLRTTITTTMPPGVFSLASGNYFCEDNGHKSGYGIMWPPTCNLRLVKGPPEKFGIPHFSCKNQVSEAFTGPAACMRHGTRT
jgi:hypothetical protein